MHPADISANQNLKRNWQLIIYSYSYMLLDSIDKCDASLRQLLAINAVWVTYHNCASCSVNRFRRERGKLLDTALRHVYQSIKQTITKLTISKRVLLPRKVALPKQTNKQTNKTNKITFASFAIKHSQSFSVFTCCARQSLLSPPHVFGLHTSPVHRLRCFWWIWWTILELKNRIGVATKKKRNLNIDSCRIYIIYTYNIHNIYIYVYTTSDR